VDVDLLSILLQQLLVEHHGFYFIENIEYEWFLPFCSFYKMIGHEFSSCMSKNEEQNEKKN